MIALVTYPDLTECQREYINASYIDVSIIIMVRFILYYITGIQ